MFYLAHFDRADVPCASVYCVLGQLCRSRMTDCVRLSRRFEFYVYLPIRAGDGGHFLFSMHKAMSHVWDMLPILYEVLC